MFIKAAAPAALFSLFSIGAAHADAVDLKGFHAKALADLADLGHLSELNGKYKIRVTQVTMDEAGYMRAHHHVGPGIRCMVSGEMAYAIGGRTTVYKPGDCFTETGAQTHESSNIGKTPVVLLNFELLPANLPDGKGSLIPEPKEGEGHSHPAP
jgi:quercetin dioxygenase-like cupin family protein